MPQPTDPKEPVLPAEPAEETPEQRLPGEPPVEGRDPSEDDEGGDELVDDEEETGSKKTGKTGAVLNNRQVTELDYKRLCEAYRERPGVHAFAKKRAGVTWRTAQRGWDQGWPKKGWRPIKEILVEEAEKARANLEATRPMREQRTREVQLNAQEQAVKARVEEGVILELGRMNLRGLLASIAELVPAVRTLSHRISLDIERLLNDPEQRAGMDIVKMLRLLREVSATVNSSSAATERLMEAERLFLGEPGKFIGLVPGGETQQMTDTRSRASALLEVIRREQSGEPQVMDVKPVSFSG